MSTPPRRSIASQRRVRVSNTTFASAQSFHSSAFGFVLTVVQRAGPPRAGTMDAPGGHISLAFASDSADSRRAIVCRQPGVTTTVHLQEVADSLSKRG
jgi:hypothetical protein